MARNLTLVASRSVVSAIPRKRAASSRRNRAFIVNPFSVVENHPMPAGEAVSKFRMTMGEAWNLWMAMTAWPTLTIWGRPPIGGYLLADAPNQRWLNRLFQFLGGSEGDLLAGLDLDGLASPRISAHPGGTVLNLEDAETGQTDFVAVLEMAGGQRHQVA